MHAWTAPCPPQDLWNEGHLHCCIHLLFGQNKLPAHLWENLVQGVHERKEMPPTASFILGGRKGMEAKNAGI